MQPQSGYGYNHLTGTAVGTTVVFDRTGTFHSIVIPASNTGTINFYDTNSGAGTTSANLVFSLNNIVNAANLPSTLVIHSALKTGLTAITSGTTDVTILYN